MDFFALDLVRVSEFSASRGNFASDLVLVSGISRLRWKFAASGPNFASDLMLVSGILRLRPEISPQT